MNDDRDASFRANTRRAIAAFENRLLRPDTLLADQSPPRQDGPGGWDLERLVGMLCGIRHLTDQFSGLRFHHVLSTANELYDWGRWRTQAYRCHRADRGFEHAIDIYERSLAPPPGDAAGLTGLRILSRTSTAIRPAASPPG